MSNGGTQDGEQPGKRPLAFEPPPWEAYFGTAPGDGVSSGASTGADLADLTETAPQQTVSVEPPPMPWREPAPTHVPPAPGAPGAPGGWHGAPGPQQAHGQGHFDPTQLFAQQPGTRPPAYQPPTYQQPTYQQPTYQQAGPAAGWPGLDAPDQNWAGQNWGGQDRGGQNWAGQDPAAQNWAGQNWAGQNWAGQNSPGQGSTGPAGPPDERPAWVIPAMIAFVAATLGIALGVMFGIGSGNDDEEPSGAVAGSTPSAQRPEPTPGPETSTSEPPREITGSREIPADEAAATLAAHGLKLEGEGRAGWVWVDANGENVLYVTRQVLRAPRGKEAATVRVMHAAHLDGDAEVLRTMQDPGRGPCEWDLMTDYTPASITVTDADADGVAEVTVGWYYACRSDVGPFDAKLALISGGDKYIFRGTGIPQEYRPESQEVLDQMPKVSFTPTPGRSGWIDGSYDAASDLFHEIYVGGKAE